jgi:hypothetical protein
VIETQQKTVSPAIKCFVVFHLIAVTVWSLPKPSDQVLNGTLSPKGTDSFLKFNHTQLRETSIIYGYNYVTGFWQYWDMFAPEPSQTDFFSSYEVMFFDGTKTKSNFHRVFDANIPEKYLIERYRKLYERVNPDSGSFLWPIYAQGIALSVASDPLNPPIRIDLIRNFQSLERHDKPQIKPPDYTHYMFFSYAVNQKQLFKDKGWNERVN